MKENKPQTRVDLSILGTEKLSPLKKHLSADDLASRTYRGYMEKLNKAREKQEEEKNGNTSGQTKS